MEKGSQNDSKEIEKGPHFYIKNLAFARIRKTHNENSLLPLTCADAAHSAPSLAGLFIFSWHAAQ